MPSILCRIDDKLVPLYRVMWLSATPHFCGEEDCQREGCFQVQLEQDETVWASDAEHKALVERIEAWQGGLGPGEDKDW